MSELHWMNKPVYSEEENIIGEVQIRMWQNTPPRYIVFNEVIMEYDPQIQGYKKEKKEDKTDAHPKD